MNASILLIDDERTFRVLAEEALKAEGFDVRTVGTLHRAREEMAAFSPDVILLDRRLPDGDGIELLPALHADGAAAPVVIVVTAYGNVQNAVEALRAGASDYLTKPVQLTDLVVKLRKVLEARQLRDRLSLARTSAAGPPILEPASPRMREVLDAIRRVSASPFTPVFLQGPSGVGKQHAAELLHARSFAGATSEPPFVEVNCAALPEQLLESELFGHEKGAFTDAKSTRRGLIEMADGGTLFLDEVTELPLRSQAKLLKFIDGMRFRRLGGTREITVALRVVAATNRDVVEAVRRGAFRDDLYHRLSVFSIAIPSLAERREDIPALAAAFVRFFAGRTNKRVSGIAPDALHALVAYAYPGNVRELRNVIERAVILADGPEITPRDVMIVAETKPQANGGFFGVALDATDLPPRLEVVERAYVARVLDHAKGKRTAAAELLGISYPTLLKRLRELGIDDGA